MIGGVGGCAGVVAALSQASLGFAQDGARALQARDFARYKALEREQQAVSKRWEAFAGDYGFKVCGFEKG